MALAIDDYILQATGGPSVMDGLVSWLKTNGASNGAMADLHDQFLTAQGFTTGTLDDRWDALLVSLGYTGSLQDKLYKFWQAGGTIGGFTPASLFSDGEVGFWYDASDLSALYQDNGGTTPVTAVEQPVGLLIDKSKAVAFGSEQTTNGTFDTDSDWTKFNTITYSGGQYTISNSPVLFAGAYIAQQLSGLTTGAVYKVTIVVTSAAVSANQASFKQGTAANDLTYGQVFIPSASFTGTWSFNITAGAANPWVTIHVSGSNENITVTSISIVQSLGNHASQSIAANRPVLRSRYNQITYSEEFDNAAWTKVGATITPNTTTAPNGTTTADTFAVSSGAYNSVYATATPLTGGAAYIASVYAKAGTNTQVTLELRVAGTTPNATFDLTNGTVASGTGAIVSAGGGWYKCSVTITTSTTSHLFIIGGQPSSAGDIYIWGAQVISVDDNTNLNGEYQSITSSTTYNTDTTKFPRYLSFDGTNDGLVTASINFSATDEMSVFAGVTNLSNVGAGVVVELSATTQTNNGTFALFAPSAASQSDFMYRSKGTAVADANGTNTFAPPSTKVITGLSDISADSTILRINGVQNVSVATDQGTGNYGNYVSYIGRRGGTVLPLNGRLYQLIVRGKTSTADEIDDTETYVASKINVTL